MKRICQSFFFLLSIMFLTASLLYSATDIPADHPYIQYFGRWDFTDPLAPSHSWPGVYIYAEFEATGIGVKLSDNYTYYNVFIDDDPVIVFKGNVAGIASYTLASGLTDGNHTILFTKRCETTWTDFSFHGFILDDGKNLLPPPDKPERKIEFIGNSFTSASGNEYTEEGRPPEGDAQYTNIYEGFGPITARNYDAQYQMTSISGWGLVLDWTGDYSKNIPNVFDQTHLYTALPVWDFQTFQPNLVVIGLGLNDYSGFGGWEGGVSEAEEDLYKSRYHEFIQTIRDEYLGVKILAVATHVEWMRETISEVVAEENSSGNYDVFYAHYSYYEGGYVNEGHPNVATHYAIANELITAIDTINAWEPYNDIKPPAFTKLPDSPFTVYDTYYNLNVETDSYSTVRYSTEDKPYSEMENDFTTTGKRKHYVTIPCQHGQQYTYYLRASDLSGNLMDTSAVITFNVDTTKSIAPWWHVNFNDSEWEEGMAPLGFGNGGEVTEIARVQTAYFRKFFQVDDPSSHSRISAILQYDNGGIVYVNGVEIGRVNMPPDEIDYNTDAESNISGNISFPLTSDDLRNGTNIIAVEIHQNIVDTSDFIFDLRLRSSSQIFIDNGSNWKYYDNGNEPENQIVSIEFNRLNDVLPSKFQLFQNYPNPFNPLTTISFDILKNNHVTLTIFDLLGREVKTLFEGRLNSGSYEFKFDGSNLASGEYFYRLQSEDFTEVKKLILFK